MPKRAYPRPSHRARRHTAWRSFVAIALLFALAACGGTPTQVEKDPPTATITSPQTGASFAWFDDDAGITSYPVDVVGTGQADDGGALLGSSLQWSYRRVSSPVWADAGTGTSTTIDIPYGGSDVIQDWEIRLIATEDALESEPANVTITVQRPPD